jgi:hypothetical protein
VSVFRYKTLTGAFIPRVGSRLVLKFRGPQVKRYVRQLTNQWSQPVGSGVTLYDELRRTSWGFSYCIAHLSLRLVGLTVVFTAPKLGGMSSSKSPQAEALAPQAQSSPAELSVTDQGNAPPTGKIGATMSTGDNQPTIEAHVSRISSSD